MVFKQAGISLIEVMVGLSLAAGISLVLMQQQDASNKMQAKINVEQNINSAVNIIQASLSNRAICSLSLQGKGVGNSVPQIIDAIVDPNNFSLFTPTGKIIADTTTMLPGDVKIIQMDIIEEGAVGNKMDYFRVTFSRNPLNKTNLLGVNNVVKKFRIQGEKVYGKYTVCYSEASNLVTTSVQESCTALGGTWNPTTEKCEGLVNVSKLIPIYLNAAGVVSTIPPEVLSSTLTCQKDPKQCARTNMDCPATCPSGQFARNEREWDRCQARVFGVCTDWACMKDYDCMYNPPASGFIVKP